MAAGCGPKRGADVATPVTATKPQPTTTKKGVHTITFRVRGECRGVYGFYGIGRKNQTRIPENVAVRGDTTGHRTLPWEVTWNVATLPQEDIMLHATAARELDHDFTAEIIVDGEVVATKQGKDNTLTVWCDNGKCGPQVME